MAIDNEYELFGVQIAGSTLFSQLTNGGVSPEIEMLVASGASALEPQFFGEVQAAPLVTFNTTQLATLLGLTGSNAWYGISGNIDLLFRRVVAQGSRYAPNSNNHLRFRGTAGLLSWQTITAPLRGPAVADVSIALVSDGVNPILAAAGGVGMGAIVPSAAEQYVMGPVNVGGSPVPGLVEWQFSSGVRVFRDSDSGVVYPTFSAVEGKSFNPKFMGRAMTAALWTTYGVDLASVTGCAAYLRKLATTGPVADVSTVHIKISQAHEVALKPLGKQGGSERARTAFELYFGDSTGAAAPITVSTASAIT